MRCVYDSLVRLCFFFFFSSRRRHTRYWRDWSSDVCSSDLKLYLQNDPVNVNELGDKIREKLLDPTRQSVYLRADQSVPFQTFATVLEHLKLAGIENVSIVTQPLTQGRK